MFSAFLRKIEELNVVVFDVGAASGWAGGRGGGRGPHTGSFNVMQANATAGQMAGMQLNSPGQLLHHESLASNSPCYLAL